VTGFFAGVPMGFSCFPRLQLFYAVTSVAVCVLMGVLLSAIPKERWDLIASVIISGTGVGYVTPAVHWLVVCDAGRAAIGSKFFTQMVITGIATMFYTKYVPECYAPGRFGLVGNSHQLWHVAIYISIALYGECLIDVSALAKSGGLCT